MLFSAAVKVVQEYERGVIFRLGRLVGAKGPGLFFIIPFVDRMVKVDLRDVTLDIPPQEVITRDNVTIKVNAVVYFRVVDPNMAVVKVVDYIRATSQIAQTTLRSVLGQSELDELLAQRDKINAKLQQIIDEQTEPWGIKCQRGRGQGRRAAADDAAGHGPPGRGRAREAGQDHPRRGRVPGLASSWPRPPTVIGTEPAALQLRYLQTLTEIAVEKNTTIIFPVPIDMLSTFLKASPVGRGRGRKTPSANQAKRRPAGQGGPVDVAEPHILWRQPAGPGRPARRRRLT